MRNFYPLAGGALLALLTWTATGCDRPATPQPVPAPPAAPAPAPAPAPTPTPADAQPAGDAPAVAPPNAAEAAALNNFVRENTAQPAGTAALPPGHPPITGSATPAPADPAAALPAGHPGVPGVTTELKFDAPATWKPEQPRSNMRKAQFVLPRAEGDAEDGELVVFYFGPGEGGGVEDNLARWRGMFTTPEGAPLPPEAMTRDAFETNGLKVTTMDVAGRYAPSAMPGMPAQGPRDAYRMLAAVVETPGGPWFFRAVGPSATIDQHKDAFRQFLTSCRP